MEQPLVILLHIRSVSKYLDGVGEQNKQTANKQTNNSREIIQVCLLLLLFIEPLLEIFQESQHNSGEKIKVGMGVQLRK